MQENRKYILLFHTIHDVLKAEKIMKKKGMRHELVPVPRNLSTDCGMCIQLQEDYQQIKDSMEGVKIYQCYSVEGTTFTAVTP